MSTSLEEFEFGGYPQTSGGVVDPLCIPPLVNEFIVCRDKGIRRGGNIPPFFDVPLRLQGHFDR